MTDKESPRPEDQTAIDEERQSDEEPQSDEDLERATKPAGGLGDFPVDPPDVPAPMP